MNLDVDVELRVGRLMYTEWRSSSLDPTYTTMLLGGRVSIIYQDDL